MPLDLKNSNVKITEETMTGTTIWFIRVVDLDDPKDERVFFDGEENCIYTHLLGLGMDAKDIESKINTFKNVKL